MTILIIDDDAGIRELVSLFLTHKGYAAVGARNGAEALAYLDQHRPLPDLILLDLMMPDLDGWEVYQRLKSNPKTTHVPIIVVTARAQSIDKILGLHIAKVDDYITKPFSPSELIASIEKVLHKKNITPHN